MCRFDIVSDNTANNLTPRNLNQRQVKISIVKQFTTIDTLIIKKKKTMYNNPKLSRIVKLRQNIYHFCQIRRHH